MQYVSYAAAECASEMIDGNISIYPFVSDKINSCSYCKYDTICAIDIIDKKIYGENSKINRYKNISSADCFSEILKKLNIDINKTEDSREDNKKYE